MQAGLHAPSCWHLKGHLTSSWRTKARSKSCVMTQEGLHAHSTPSLRLSRARKDTPSSSGFSLSACAWPAAESPFASGALLAAA